MSLSLCLNCGVLKVGAFDECPECGEGPPDADVALCFTTHHLTEHELEQIGLAVKALNQIEVNEDTRFHAFLHFVSRKWPKVLEYDINLIEPELSENIDALYRTHLADLPGQQTAELGRPHWAGERWEQAWTKELQAAEDEWKEGVSNIVLHSVNTAREIVALIIEGGEGAFLQKISIRIRNTVRGIDARALAQHADSLVADAAEYERLVGRYRKPVKNGWSGRTKQRAVYLGGTHVRLTEMAQLCRKVMRHKAGLEPLIPLEFKRAKQEFNLSHSMFMKLVDVVLHPQKIPYAAPEE